jgi:hypothetical protein
MNINHGRRKVERGDSHTSANCLNQAERPQKYSFIPGGGLKTQIIVVKDVNGALR